jgi:hypothetical protein
MILLNSAILLVLSGWLPWWFIAVFCIATGFVLDRRVKIFTQLVPAVFLTWMGVSYFLDFGMSGKVGGRIAAGIQESGFALPSISIYFFVGLIGAMLATVYGLFGYELRVFRHSFFAKFKINKR